jgi:S-adenosylmethionine-diacylglycerol 3-amino-3-carboxypropyl transferase
MPEVKLDVSRWVFNQIHSRNLIYNQCWEDPDLDNAVLGIGPEDRIVTITSAGCNALDYLLQDPASIHCVDVNPYQNALLELKIAAIAALRYQQFFEMFGNGRIVGHRRIYHEHLRPQLTAAAQAVWDRKIDYFDHDGAGLYYHGTAGFFARTVCLYLKSIRGLRGELEQFQYIFDLDEQASFYRERIAPKLWSPAIRFLMRRSAVLSLLGIPREQCVEIRRSGRTSLDSFIEERVEKTFTTVPMYGNYFWRVYINGSYAPGCCPNYLKRENFNFLRNRTGRIQIQTRTLTDCLRSTSERFSVFVLLDHMDWLSCEPRLLEEEWRAIIDRAAPGARIIYRSGSLNCDYIPPFAIRRLEFEPDRTKELHDSDRVGTYASFHFAKVTP